MKAKVLVATAVLVAALVSACCASAAVVVYTVEGTIASVSGDPNVRAGDRFTAAFDRDDATPGASIDLSSSSIYMQSSIEQGQGPVPVVAEANIGGRIYDGTNPFFDYHDGSQSQLKVYLSQGYEEFQLSSNQSFVQTELAGYYSLQRNEIERLTIGAVGIGTNYLSSGDYHTLGNLTSASAPGLSLYGEYEFDEYYALLYRNVPYYEQYDTEVYILAPTSISVTQPGSVPEPSSWALMIGGMGLAGALLRRQRALTAWG